MIFQDGILCLSPSSSITKASFKFWLETELNTFHSCNRSENHVIAFVFVSEAFVEQFQPERLDKALKKIGSKTNKWLSEIDIVAGDHYQNEEAIQLFIDELIEEGKKFALSEQEIFIGYANERAEGESPFDEAHDPVCVVRQVTKHMIEAMSQDQADLGYQEGDWSVSGGTHENMIISKPFKTMEEAMDAAKERFGAIRFTTAPQFDEFS